MAMLRTWGDELTLRAAVDVFGVVVHCVTTDKENWLLHYEGDAGVGANKRTCFLAYVSPIHYNVVSVPFRAQKQRMDCSSSSSIEL
mmetsp:Transcript_60654/g.106263  ORF Transcript_60654/g.106263 Transcript_60654/m.106263 type:complete len:86 (-) Transcript_60654:62-319(-)